MTVTVTTDSLYPTVSTQKLSEQQDFTLTFKNPCFDTNFVQINAPTLLKYDHIVFSQPAQTEIHPEFTVTYSPQAHSLCGTLVYTATFDSASVTSSS